MISPLRNLDKTGGKLISNIKENIFFINYEEIGGNYTELFNFKCEKY